MTKGLRRFIIWLFWYYLPVLRSEVVTVISEKTRAELFSAVPQAKNKTVYIPDPVLPGFDYFPPQLSTTRPRFLHIGKTQNKNTERHIRALAGRSAELVLVGKPADGLLDLASELGVNISVRHGLSRDQLITEYRRSFALLYCSTYEGFGMPIIEAQSVGRPIITSDRSPMREVAGPGGALFVNPESVDEIGHAIDQVIASKSLRNQLVKAGRRNAISYSLAHVAELYFEVYSELAGEKTC